MNPTYHSIGRILSVLVIGSLIFTARVYASPAQQSLTLEELSARLVSLEELVAAQNEQIESLNVRVAELECALEAARCETTSPTIPEDWVMGVSSDTILRYQYDPNWELTDDEPGRLAFYLRNNLQGVWIHWMRWPDFVQELLADETQLREFETELLQIWSSNNEVAELLSTSQTTISGKPALLWEMSFIADDGLSNRMLGMHYDCGEAYTCEIALLQFGLDRQFRSEDHAMVRTLMSTLEIVTGSATVTRNANLRACPGLSCDVIGRAIRGQAIEIIGQSEDGDWYQIVSGEWISASLVDGAPEDIPIISDSVNL